MNFERGTSLAGSTVVSGAHTAAELNELNQGLEDTADDLAHLEDGFADDLQLLSMRLNTAFDRWNASDEDLMTRASFLTAQTNAQGPPPLPGTTEEEASTLAEGLDAEAAEQRVNLERSTVEHQSAIVSALRDDREALESAKEAPEEASPGNNTSLHEQEVDTSVPPKCRAYRQASAGLAALPGAVAVSGNNHQRQVRSSAPEKEQLGMEKSTRASQGPNTRPSATQPGAVSVSGTDNAERDLAVLQKEMLSGDQSTIMSALREDREEEQNRRLAAFQPNKRPSDVNPPSQPGAVSVSGPTNSVQDIAIQQKEMLSGDESTIMSALRADREEEQNRRLLAFGPNKRPSVNPPPQPGAVSVSGNTTEKETQDVVLGKGMAREGEEPARPRHSSMELHMTTLERTQLHPQTTAVTSYFATQSFENDALSQISPLPSAEPESPVTPGAVHFPMPGSNSTSYPQEEEWSPHPLDDPSPRPLDEMIGHRQSGDLIEAYTVSETFIEERENMKATIKAEVEEEVRNQLMQEALEANVVACSVDNGNQSKERKSWLLLCGSVLVIGLVVTAMVLLAMLLPGDNDNNINNNDQEMIQATNETVPRNSTLEAIRQRGFLKCGVVTDRLGFCSPKGVGGELQGFNVDQCKAISMAIFGNPDQVSFELLQPFTRFTSLSSGKVDVLTDTVTHNMERDIYLHQTKSGFTFSTPYLYTGLSFWGPAEYLECAESLDTQTGVCKNLTVCVPAFGTHEQVLRTLLPPEAVVPVLSFEELAESLEDGSCVAGAGDSIIIGSAEYKGGVSGTKLFSREPLALVTREDDHEFSSLVDLVVNVFFLAEAHSITHNNATELFTYVGGGHYGTLIPIIMELGNYADLYQRHLQNFHPRGGLNELYSKSDDSGLLYSFPFGPLTQEGPDPDPLGVIATIKARGLLRCGVVDRGGGIYNEVDAQFCRAVSAALFSGSKDKLELMMLSVDASYQTLLGGSVDVLAGVQLSPEHAFKEPTTDRGFSLSKPYYYDTVAMEAYGFATNTEDPKWADLMNWVIMGIIYAEESGIGYSTADEMPLLSPFGQSMATFLQDVVAGVGSYDEIYSQTLEAALPRAGSGNELNHAHSGPQFFSIPF